MSGEVGGGGGFDPSSFGVSRERGFLPDTDPEAELPLRFHGLHELAAELPKRLLAGRLRRDIEALAVPDVADLESDAERRSAMRVLSFLAHGYVWAEDPPATRLPAALAIPWVRVARVLGRPPVLSYASYALDNWRRIDPEGPVELDNIRILQNFLGGADEDWFIGIHIEIEALAAPILCAVEPLWSAVEKGDEGVLESELASVAAALERMVATLRRTPEHCDPYIYFQRVRPFIHGWKEHPALPEGLLYDGVDEFSGRPQRLRGETGAQSAVVPSVDALLGIAHRPDPLRRHLDEMRDYMPPGHRRLLETVERGPSLRAAVASSGVPSLCEVYDESVHWLERFRAIHLDYAGRYIHSQGAREGANPNDVGTGGTPFMTYLAKHRDETAAARLSSS